MNKKNVIASLVGLCALFIAGQGFAQTNDHGTSCSTATLVELNSGTVGELASNDNDFFLFEVPNPHALVTVSTMGDTNTTGELSKLIDGKFIPLADHNPFGNFLISQALEEGTYCVEVTGHNQREAGDYLFQVEADLPGDDHGNSCTTATPVGKSDIVGELTVYDDRDFFLFQVPPEGGTITVSTMGDTNTTGRLFKLDENDGRFIYQNIRDYSNGHDSNFLISQALEEGTYCVEVTGQNQREAGDYLFQTTGAFIPAGSCSGEAVSLSATEWDFGNVRQNKVRRRLIILENTGEEPLFIDSVTLAGANPVQFGIVNDNCSGRVLQPGQTEEGEKCWLKAAFVPLNEGPKTASLLISCNASDSLPLKVELKGHGFIQQ